MKRISRKKPLKKEITNHSLKSHIQSIDDKVRVNAINITKLDDLMCSEILENGR